MRVALVIAAVLLGLVLLGWITFRGSSNEATITIEADKIRQDTGEAVQEGKSMLREAKENLSEQELDRPEERPSREPVELREPVEQRQPVEQRAGEGSTPI